MISSAPLERDAADPGTGRLSPPGGGPPISFLAPPRRARRRDVALALLGVLAVAVLAQVAGDRLAAVDQGAARGAAPVVSAVPLATPGQSLAEVARLAIGRTATVETLRSGAEELGTGWLIDNRGDFVTNAHVIESRLTVRLRDRTGVAHDGIVLGVDRAQDIAVIRSRDGFAGAPLVVRDPGSGDVPVPYDVVALASSRATGHSDSTDERVSGLHRDVPVAADLEAGKEPTAMQYHDMIELRGAMIFAGNSGGPVLDRTGQVIGIVTLGNKAAPVAFAIPIGRVLDELQVFAARTKPIP